MAALTQYALGVVLAFHGLVHAWYVVLSRGWIEPDEEEFWGWNGRSWLLSGVLPERHILDVASVLYAVVAAGFVAGGAGYALAQGWAPTVLVGSAVLSTLALLLTWDGRFDHLADKGAVGVVINAVVLGWILVL